MIKTFQITLTLQEEAQAEEFIRKKVQEELGEEAKDLTEIKILKKSIDARRKEAIINYRVEVFIGEKPVKKELKSLYRDVDKKKVVHIIGFGPGGMFAALRCLELGIKPVVLERGNDVQARRRDLRAINQFHEVNEDSNYCFGEGGAGTYSDGKLYTRSLKRGDVRKVFETFVAHGASEDILIDAHPHIGTNKLPRIVKNIRETILEHGGEIRFNTKVTDFKLKDNAINEVILASGETLPVEAVILATGHSARDIYELLHKHRIEMREKSFAMGVRIEHPQEVIDSIQYHCSGKRPDVLPAAAYNVTQQVKGRGVYSFCMCPGGFIVPSATAPGEVVVNGMSPSRRDNFFANSGMVVEIKAETDLGKYEEYGVFRGLQFQKELERLAFTAGGRSQKAPAQRMTDFVEGRLSERLNPCSYQPGLTSAPLHSLLPKIIGSRLRQGLKEFGKAMKGYYTETANVVGVESRTSSPIQIPRDEKFRHPRIENLFPCGEGAGYAGGIVSAAMDGEKCANSAIALIS